MEEYHIKISRFNPEVDSHPYMKDYNVPRATETVLEALIYVYDEIDSTLLFSYGCRYRVCGKCAIKINGKPSLACETSIRDGMVLEPLDHFPVIRDLGIDRSGLIDPLRKHKIFVSPMEGLDAAIQPPEFFQLIKCNECLSCISDCPVFNQGLEYDGPFFGVKIAELHYDVRNRRQLLGYLESYLEKCILCKRCDINCPWDIKFSEICTKIKGELYKRKKTSVRDWLISHPRLVGFLVTSMPFQVNTFFKRYFVRRMMGKWLGIDERMTLPEYRRIPKKL